jgi:hypothetical protein
LAHAGKARHAAWLEAGNTGSVAEFAVGAGAPAPDVPLLVQSANVVATAVEPHYLAQAWKPLLRKLRNLWVWQLRVLAADLPSAQAAGVAVTECQL